MCKTKRQRGRAIDTSKCLLLARTKNKYKKKKNYNIDWEIQWIFQHGISISLIFKMSQFFFQFFCFVSVLFYNLPSKLLKNVNHIFRFEANLFTIVMRNFTWQPITIYWNLMHKTLVFFSILHTVNFNEKLHWRQTF